MYVACVSGKVATRVSSQVHHVTRQVEYRGDVVNLTEALVGFPAGGQILLSGSTYQRLYGRLHTVRFDDQMPGQAAQTAISQPGGSRPPGCLLHMIQQ